jgi:hypothetical protein
MASTPLLGLALPADGITNWGTLVNTSITALLDSAIAGTTTISSTTTPYVLTTTVDAANEARQAVILCTGARAAVQTIVAPFQSKTYVVINATTGGFGVKIVGVGPTTGVTVPTGRAYMVAWNGSDFVITGLTTVDLATDVTGVLPIANGGTGSTTAAGARTSLGATTVGGNMFTLTNPSAVTFPRFNADNTVSALNAADFRTAIGSTTVGGNLFTLTNPSAITFPRFNADNTVSALSDVNFRTAIGSTTVGGSMFTLTNPSAITFPKFNADNTVSALNAADFRTAIGAGTGTVTSVTGTAPVASSGGATPAISLAADYGDSLNPYASKTANFVLAAPNGAAGVPTFRALVAADVPTLNQNTTGTAAGLSATLAVASGGTGVTTSTGTGSVVLNNAPTLTAPQFADQGYIADSVGNRVLNFTTNSASVNYINITASVSGQNPTVSAVGAGTNISLILSAKGTGKVRTNTDLLVGGFINAGNGTGSFSANTIFGESVLSSNVSGEYITAMGTNAAAGVTTAQYLTAFGNGAGQTITTSNKHSAFGYRALYSMATMADSGDNWNGCTAVGFRALQSNTGNASVSDSVGVGAGALYSSTTGTLNVALGNGALYSATTASSNVAVGWKALFLHNNTDAVGIGYNAAATMVNSPITAVGSGAAEVATGSSVTAIGYRALRLSTTGTDITVVGSGAFQNCVTGCNNNTVIGASAANNMTFGLSNTYVGAAVVASTASSTSNEIAIGASVTGKGSNTAFIGGTSGAYNGKNVTTWETTSDERIKRNIVDSPKGLAEINQLRVRNFQYKEEADMPKTEDGAPAVVGLDPNKQVTGFIAQEIQTVFPEAVATHAHDILSVSADPVLYAMVKAIQELTARLEALEAK